MSSRSLCVSLSILCVVFHSFGLNLLPFSCSFALLCLVSDKRSAKHVSSFFPFLSFFGVPLIERNVLTGFLVFEEEENFANEK